MRVTQAESWESEDAMFVVSVLLGLQVFVSEMVEGPGGMKY